MSRPHPAPGERRPVSLHVRGGLFVAAILFGMMAVCVRLAARQMAPTQIAFFRFAGSFLVMLLATRGRGLVLREGSLVRLLLRGCIGTAAILLYFWGIEGAGAGLASLLQSTYPIVAAVLGSALLGERVTPRLVFALLLNIVGSAVVFGRELQIDPAARLGMLCALGSAVLAGAAVVTARQLRHTETAALITTYFMAVGTLVTAPSLLAGLPRVDVHLGAALVGVILTSVGAQWLLHHGLGFVSAASAGIVAGTGVATAAALEAALFGEAVSRGTILGGLLMIVAVGLASNLPHAPRTRSRRAAVSDGLRERPSSLRELD